MRIRNTTDRMIECDLCCCQDDECDKNTNHDNDEEDNNDCKCDSNGECNFMVIMNKSNRNITEHMTIVMNQHIDCLNGGI